MQGTQLLEHVASENRAEVQKLYETFVRTAGPKADENIDSFANALHERGLLSDEGLKDFLTYHALIVGTLEPPSDEETERYQLLALLGRGAMGEVYLGRDPSLKRTIAVKRVHADLAKDPLLLQRFFNEAQVTAQLDHPAIVPVYGLERDAGGVLSYAMKFVRGVTLSRFLEDARAQAADKGKPDPSHSLKARIETFIPVLNALAYAHRRGVIHRDLKPENIMVGPFGEVLLMDWGIARVLGQEEPAPAPEATAGRALRPEKVPEASEGAPEGAAQASRGATDTAPTGYATHPKLTLAGTVLGTPAYMSPEQAAGLDIDQSSDQYSLGLILQEIVTLQPAMAGDSLAAMFAKAIRGMREPIVAGPEKVARELKAIIDKASAPSRKDRYASVIAMAEDIRRFLRDESVAADPDRGLRKVTRWIARHRSLAVALAAIGAVVAFAVVVVFIWRGQVALADQREAAVAHERSMAQLEGLVDEQAAKISQELHRYESLLEGIASTATLVLSEPAQGSNAVTYTYHDGQRDPPDMPAFAVDSKIYKQAASLHADYSAAWGVDRTSMRWRTDQLGRMEKTMRDALLRSKSEETVLLPFAEAENLVIHQGVPALWTYLHTEDGLGVGVPGTWEYDNSPGAAGYDHRREDWYKIAVDTHGPFWTITADESGFGLTVNCVETVRDTAGKLVAIAGLDVWLNRFIDELLDIPALSAAGAEAIVLDAEGRVLIRTTEREKAATLSEYKPIPFEHAPALAAMKATPSGQITLDDGKLVIWAKLGSAGLTYVVLGVEATLIAGLPQ